VAALARQELALLFRLHAFRDDVQPQAVGQADDRLGDGGVVGVGQDVLDELAVDLQLVQRQPLQVRQRRVADAEVVERQPTPISFRLRILATVTSMPSASRLSVSSSFSLPGPMPAWPSRPSRRRRTPGGGTGAR
jgi:hypothetical protein